MIIKDINKKINNTPDNIKEELAPISEEYIKGLFENLEGDDSDIDINVNLDNYYTKNETDEKIEEINSSIDLLNEDILVIDSKIEENNNLLRNEIDNITSDLGKVENTKYSTTNGIKEFTCSKDGYVNNVVIEGKTLVNLANYDMGIRALTEASGNIWTTNGGSKYGSFTESNGVITYNTGSERWSDFGCLIPVTEGQSIRFIVDVVENAEKINCMAMFYNDIPTTDLGDANIDKMISLNKTVTSTELGLCDNQFKIPQGAKYGLFIISCSAENSVYKFKNLMLLENNTDDIRHFEGLKSVGQGDKIEVLSYKENLLDKNLLKNLVTGGTTGETSASDKRLSLDYSDRISVKDDIVLRIKMDANFDVSIISFDDILGTLIGDSGYMGNEFFYELPKGTKYITFNIKHNNNIKITNTDISYMLVTQKPLDKKQISTTLRSLPNGVKDTIEKRGNKYVKVQRCEEVTLNGSEDITSIYSPNNDASSLYRRVGFKVKNIPKSNVPCYCDKLKSIIDYEIENYNVLPYSVESCLFITIPVSDLTSSDGEGAKEWLQSNPVTVVYELKTPQIIELPNFNPQTYEGGTTLVLNSGVIQGECSFEVTNSKGGEIEVLKDKVSNLDVEVQKAFQYGDNVKNKLVDKLISEGLDVSTNNTFDELIENIALGKKWASGVSKSDTSTSQFYTRSASNGSLSKMNFYACTVKNLSFKPSIVVGYEPNCTRSYNPHSIFVRDATNSYGDMMISCNFEILYDYGVTEYFESGFKLPCKYSGMTLEWYAFE